MKKKISYFLLLICISVFVLIEACNDDIGPSPQCNNCTADFPWSTDGSDTCYETKEACETAEGVDCFVCL